MPALPRPSALVQALGADEGAPRRSDVLARRVLQTLRNASFPLAVVLRLGAVTFSPNAEATCLHHDAKRSSSLNAEALWSRASANAEVVGGSSVDRT